MNQENLSKLFNKNIAENRNGDAGFTANNSESRNREALGANVNMHESGESTCGNQSKLTRARLRSRGYG